MPHKVRRGLESARRCASVLRARMYAGLRPGRWIKRRKFEEWSRECVGLDPVHHFQALDACWPYLRTSPQKFLDIGPDPVPWLKTIRHFAGTGHKLSGCRLSAGETPAIQTDIFPLSAIELDPWSPLATLGLLATVPDGGYTLITAVNLVDRLYHPELLLTACSQALQPGGVLVLTAENISARANLLKLLAGGGVMPDLLALVDHKATARPLVRRYGWRELVNAGMEVGFTPVIHRFYDDPTVRISEDATTRALREVTQSLIPERDQLKTHFCLVLRKTTLFFSQRIHSYMLRRAPRASLRYLKDRVIAFRKVHTCD